MSGNPLIRFEGEPRKNLPPWTPFKRRTVASLSLGASAAFATLFSCWLLLGEHVRRVNGHQDAWLCMSDVQRKIERFRNQHARLPATLAEVLRGPNERDTYHDPKDAWGCAIAYRVKGEVYSLVSTGRDGRPGGVGLDADILLSGGSLSNDSAASTILASPPVTFGQFLAVKSHRPMVVICLIFGAVTSFVSYWLLQIKGLTGDQATPTVPFFCTLIFLLTVVPIMALWLFS